MSNPAVITLSQNNISFKQKILNRVLKKNTVSIRIEDNIGEAIHIHIDDFRIDFTMIEFEEFANEIEAIFIEYISGINPMLARIPVSFLKQISSSINKVKEVTIIHRKLSELKIIENINLKYNILKIKKLKKSLITESVGTITTKFETYKQNDQIFEPNRPRLDKLKKSIIRNGYPYNDQYIIVFGKEDNLIRDGQHRAAILYNNNSEDVIPVMRISFKEDSLKITRLSSYLKYTLYLVVKLFHTLNEIKYFIKLNK